MFTAKRIGMKRRKFISTVAAASAFTIIKPGLVRGTQANSKIEIGFIGLGKRGRMIAKMLEEHGGYHIKSIADYYPDVAETQGNQFSVSKKNRFFGLSGYKKLLETKVDAVFCETPPYCFPDHVSAAINAGCHIYMAKPVACDVPGWRRIEEATTIAKKNKKVFLIDFQTRTDPIYQEALNRVHQGDIGDIGIISVRSGSDGFQYIPKEKTIENRLKDLLWVHDDNIGGGLYVNYDIHAIDVGLWISKDAKPVSAVGRSKLIKSEIYGDSHDTYSITLELENDMMINCDCEHLRNLDGGISCFAFGTDGHIDTHYGEKKTWVHSNQRSYKGGVVENLYTNGARRNIKTFHDNIVNGIYDNVTVEPSLNSTLATILGREAGKRSEKLTLKQLLKENKELSVDTTGLIA